MKRAEAKGRFGNFFRAERDRRGVSLREIAKLTGVSKSNISRVERGTLPGLEVLDRLCRWSRSDGTAGISLQEATGWVLADCPKAGDGNEPEPLP